jgi:A/G-specific adenine glycosylase
MRGDFSVFRKSLLGWFDEHKRDLPWRRDPTLYKTVVSEFMLQQTQVDTVRPYFEAWLTEFPDFDALAAAPEDRVLKGWEGLGYYSRARNLHKLARSIVADGVPASAAEWRQRPGVGPYTAAAISSIAQQLPEPVIDGNVIRVLSRISNDATPVRSSAEAQKRFLPLARNLIDPRRPGDFNEAVMELGATVCRKARPACLLCPVREHCSALAVGTADSLPVIPRKATTRREVHRLWLLKDNRILLLVHPDNASRLAGLAELPLLSQDPGTRPLLSRSRGISSETIREHIHALPTSHPLAKQCLSLEHTQWVLLDTLDNLSLSAPHKRWITHLLNSRP